MGKEPRISGTVFRHGMLTNEFIHPTVRLRGYGRIAARPPVTGYSLAKEDDEYKWMRNPGQRYNGPREDSTESMKPFTIPEATLSVREAQSLGISLSH